MNNDGNYIISLGVFCRWLAERAENLGVEIYPGFAAAEILFDEEGSVRGIATNELGLEKMESPLKTICKAWNLIGRQTIFAEGCEGTLQKNYLKDLIYEKEGPTDFRFRD